MQRNLFGWRSGRVQVGHRQPQLRVVETPRKPSFCSGAGLVALARVVGMACVMLVLTAVPALAQTSGTSFPDIADVIPIDEIGTKVTTFLVTSLGIVIAIKLGIVLGKKMLKWFGSGV